MFKSLFGKTEETKKTVQGAFNQLGGVPVPPKKVRIMETILRDGHQSVLATRMRTRHMEPMMDAMDAIGYEAVECWGGATFDSMIRFLDENPWERLRILKQHFKKTPLQMLLRGQNLLGYQHYADDVVKEFVKRAIDTGIDRIRVFDALNDARNMETAIRAGIEAGGHVQGAMVYTISPVHTDENFIAVAQELVDMGVHSLCIKDMSGLLAPYDAASLIRKLKERFSVPIDLHCHFTCGLADMTYLKAVENGCDIIDTALSPFGFATSQPGTESIVAAFKGTPYDSGLDLTALEAAASYFRKVKKEIETEFGIKAACEVIPEVRRYQIPGGMLSNTQNQLREMGMEDRLFDVLEEMPRVRADMGYPPLVTPTSQMVGTMATMNVMMGERYKMIPNEIKELIRGKYGRLPGPISPEIKKIVIGDEESISKRPADDIPPQMGKFRDELNSHGFINLTEEDYVTYAVMKEAAIQYFEKNRR